MFTVQDTPDEMVEIEDLDDEEANGPPVDIQSVRRRGGVSAEPINEDDLGDFVKKVRYHNCQLKYVIQNTIPGCS